MSTPATTSQLSGFFKEVYPDEVISLIPRAARVQARIPFGEAERVGNKYHQPVVVAEEGGFTYAAAGDGAFTLAGATSMVSQDAQLDGSQVVLQAQMDYETAAKATEKGAKAFGSATELQVKNMIESARSRLEISILHGRSGLGQNGAADTNVNATTTKVNFSAATFAPLIWSGKKGHAVVFYNSSTLVSSGADAIFIVSAVDVANKIVTFTGTSTGISALDTASSSTLDAYWYTSVTGSLSHKDMQGIHSILTTSGSVMNIDNSVYDLWAGNSYNFGSVQCTFGKIQSAVALAVGRGLDEDVTCWVNPLTWKDLSNDLASLRRLDGSYSSGTNENGQEFIKFFSANGSIEIIPHGYVKGGEMFILPMKRLKRVGAQDISFKTPGKADGDDIFLQLPTSAGFEYRLYSHQAVLITTPAKCLYGTGIVNLS